MRRDAWWWIVAALPALLGVDLLRAANKDVEQGNAKFQSGEAKNALELYDKALAEGLEDPQARAATEFNRGVALSAQKQHDEAAQAFLEATKSKDNGLRARAFYNLGNTFFKGEKFGEAVEAYKRSLVMDPGNADAKWNLELALRRKRDQEEKQKNEKQDQQKEDQPQQQDQQKQDQPQQQDQQKQDQQQQQDQQKEDQPQQQDQQKEDQQQQQDQQKQDQQQQDDNGAGDEPPRQNGAQKQPSKQNEPQPAPGDEDAQNKTPPPAAAGEGSEGQAGAEPPAGAPDMKEINAILDSLERSPHELEQQRARLRTVRRRPPVKDW